MRPQKTETVPVQVVVPVIGCGRCKKESTCVPRFEQAPNGMTVMLLQPLFVPLHIGKEQFFLCADCYEFVRGALAAMGLEGLAVS